MFFCDLTIDTLYLNTFFVKKLFCASNFQCQTVSIACKFLQCKEGIFICFLPQSCTALWNWILFSVVVALTGVDNSFNLDTCCCRVRTNVGMFWRVCWGQAVWHVDAIGKAQPIINCFLLNLWINGPICFHKSGAVEWIVTTGIAAIVGLTVKASNPQSTCECLRHCCSASIVTFSKRLT